MKKRATIAILVCAGFLAGMNVVSSLSIPDSYRLLTEDNPASWTRLFRTAAADGSLPMMQQMYPEHFQLYQSYKQQVRAQNQQQIDRLERIRAINPNVPAVLHALATAYIEAGEVEKAAQLRATIMSIDPGYGKKQ